ncbi:methyl-CpG-binding domain protein 4-like protein [Punica granatum]|uniref:HhH-GPD domain-containing protein n=2 Tax=Punica granatum TaxID=22663 RepID=A0A218VWG0_PUNGR|nr:methyl-CpG-binding domain protein 4-like protein [Punica granatum]OWM64663.1 hypothetical protein CDL15_Pgr012315 [Punica granatum]PKI66302.1 hypothetical protein CRG98_013264 [Punica granatum]
MEETNRALDMEIEVQKGEANKKEKTKRKKKGRVVSRFFQQNQGGTGGCINGNRTERRGKRSRKKEERVVSRFFQNRQPEPDRGTKRKRSRCDDSRAIARIEEPIPSTTVTEEKKERTVSRFFQNGNGEPRGRGVESKLAAALDGGEIPDIEELFSRFAYTKKVGSDDIPSESKARSMLSPRFRNTNVSRGRLTMGKRINAELIADSAAEPQPEAETEAAKAKKKKVKSSNGSTILSAKEKKKEAYRRRDADNTWKPPRSVHRLLQEDHAHDPWRVLVICMLLNCTTGKQTGQILEKLFSEFPNAQAAADAPEERIEEIIRTLGLQKKRSCMIKRMSQEYLDHGWTHVTQLHGVGKYAADAYAIFCTGKWDQVSPVDHKLKDYWDYLWTIEDRLR